MTPFCWQRNSRRRYLTVQYLYPGLGGGRGRAVSLDVSVCQVARTPNVHVPTTPNSAGRYSGRTGRQVGRAKQRLKTWRASKAAARNIEADLSKAACGRDAWLSVKTTEGFRPLGSQTKLEVRATQLLEWRVMSSKIRFRILTDATYLRILSCGRAGRSISML